MGTLEILYKEFHSPSDSEIGLFSSTFKECGTDKSGYHNYELVYSCLFNNTDSIKNILEVGIHFGCSLRAWKRLFTNAEIIGLDNNSERFFTEDRIESRFVDQGIPESFDNLILSLDGKKFDFIVDDGCHMVRETIYTFNRLLPLLNNNGVFVVEDIKREDISAWSERINNISDSYLAMLVPMYDICPTNFDDNNVLVVRKVK